MAPFQHPQRSHNTAEGSSTTTRGRGSSRGRGSHRGRGGATPHPTPGSIPTGSISKLKAQLRQTNRLLARDDLTPDVRVTSERRLKSLTTELEKTIAESAKVELEKKMAVRYRGVRFFERQKILRKIKQAKSLLTTSPTDAHAIQSLLQSRIDLYYILNYPKTSKYISLFPSGLYSPHLPLPPKNLSKKDSNVLRSEMREGIRGRMERGLVGEEVERGFEEEEEEDGEEESGRKRGLDEEEEEEEEEKPKKKVKKEKEREKGKEKVEGSQLKKIVAVAEASSSDGTNAEEGLELEVEVELEAKEKEKKRNVRETKQEKKERKEKKKKLKMGGEDRVEEEQGQGKEEGWAGEDDFFSGS